MDSKILLDNIPSTEYPIALGGCRAENLHHECCDYNIIIFDNSGTCDSIVQIDDEIVRLHHANLNESRIEVLCNYRNLEILSDPKWELKIFLSKIKEKQERILDAYYKKCIIESQVSITKAKHGLVISDPLASCWIKCASYFLVDAILIRNQKQNFPVHTLDIIRNLKLSKLNKSMSLITECIGLERSTNSLLSRMLKSTQGFSDMIEKNNHSKIIKNKADYLIKNSLLSDCYFYLGNVNRNNFYKIKTSQNNPSEFIHILKTGFDLENDIVKLESHVSTLNEIANDLVKN
jgi:hypothetical protein